MNNYWISEAFGYLSCVCWFLVFTPQIYENYKNQSGESLSVLFLIIWLIGDFFSIAGIVLHGLKLQQLILAVYYAIVDAFLLIQVFYYRWKTYYGNEDYEQRLPLISTKVSFWRKLWIVLTFNASVTNALTMTKFSDNNPTVALLADILGYASALLYVGSRVPQLVKNHQSRSCEGLSMFLFVFALAGNLSYVIQIIFHYLDKDDTLVLVQNIPYFIGSAGTMIFDLLIFAQFFLYRKRATPMGYEAIQEEEKQNKAH